MAVVVYMAKASCLREFSKDQHVPGVRLKDKLILVGVSLPYGKKIALGHEGLQSISRWERTKECPSGQFTEAG